MLRKDNSGMNLGRLGDDLGRLNLRRIRDQWKISEEEEPQSAHACRVLKLICTLLISILQRLRF